MRRVRTINGAFAEIKAMDPNSAITLCAIRRAVSEGDIPSRRVGSRGGYKFLVDVDAVLRYFCGGTGDE